jgi:hypothetical protein
MKLPTESSSSWSHIGFATYTWASLVAWSEFADLNEAERAFLRGQAVELRICIDELLREARETQDAVLFTRPLAQARQNATLLLLKRRLNKALALVINFLGGSSKDHPIVRRFLPDLLTGITGSRIGDRARLCEEATARLSGIEGELPGRESLVAELEDVTRRTGEAVDNARTAYDAWSSERSEEVVAKGKLRLEIERTHRALGAQFAGQRTFVESFFLKGSKPSEGSEEIEPPTDG